MKFLGLPLDIKMTGHVIGPGSIVDGKVYTVKGVALQRWINKRRGELKGPRGLLFSQRPTLY